ncbi:hypothetical protein COW36_06600 [bacterium (Candidatus Blackallbacteria) CG17_big_fil_post_rev_8_21_14_2_50_48_46]|uniref:Uncharacterized protein n=1 Tax=bacterium (Candidatus Blackallbacteria) CG17_big_fil_post_rev_8_21_14_2_50_48_46 TaxID=2014261 RepID=A0A2M7G7K9_9BACT|nr:MAG: hypothetical protein COW64_22995 [bacterium (Candidatus Blackallbacteria) CG18_big_fil_WC_8_21_14_2_50_49_26]PIW18007.1 MAG: hypothetical protein COW36_06600 [bacterium (Candidatus Blackallbacteria) CG17_big_fil_post_rev_8_21_14_2_50_48_46]PIW49652.1 MAG: hypothetical protein COW20_05320 [bacterium (Candidatus Blackallbacteria) CG13_big_fil_rev_8_21_14_2_50_49_14]
MITQKYVAHYISHGVILHRYFIGDSADEVGSAAFWDQHIKELFAQHPFTDYWAGLDLQIWHMDSPRLDEMRAQGLVNLEDFDLVKAGCQVAAGLFFSKDRLDLGVFPPGYQADSVSPNKLTVTNLNDARRTLSHEAGHFHAMMSGYGSTSAFISKELTRCFSELRPPQAQNEGECWAEVYRAFMGSDEVRGTFSDGVQYTPAQNLRLFNLMRAAYWLQGNLNQRIIDRLQVSNSLCFWQDFSLQNQLFQAPKLVSNGWFGVDANWNKHKWSQNKTTGQWAWERV